MGNPNPTRKKLPPGPGRPKGSKNAIAGTAKEAIQMAFDGLGGVPALIKWAQEPKNVGEFYTKVWTRILPHEVTGPNGSNIGFEVKIAFVAPTLPHEPV